MEQDECDANRQPQARTLSSPSISEGRRSPSPRRVRVRADSKRSSRRSISPGYHSPMQLLSKLPQELLLRVEDEIHRGTSMLRNNILGRTESDNGTETEQINNSKFEDAQATSDSNQNGGSTPEIVGPEINPIEDGLLGSKPSGYDSGTADDENDEDSVEGRRIRKTNDDLEANKCMGPIIGIDEMTPIIQLYTQVKPNVNTYQQKKNLAQGMMDLALLSANASQLRYVLESTSAHPYYYSSITFIAISIITQIMVGIGLIMNSRYDVNDEKDICKADKINNFTVLGVFLITFVNVFITSFSVASPQDADAFPKMPSLRDNSTALGETDGYLL